MRPVNLLPEGERARRAPSATGNLPYVVLGVLGALLVAMLAYVLTQNQISSKSADISRAQQETQVAEQRAARLGSFGEFSELKETRVRSVTELAQARFDWERLVRELALVLPEKTWLTDLTASTSADETTGAAPPAPATAGSAAAAETGPSVKLTGCSVSQRRVAIVMVRLRKLYRATDVELSEAAAEESGSGGGAGPPSSGGPAGAGSTGCPAKTFKFETTVSFAPAAEAVQKVDKRRVPTKLGGGA